MPAKSAKQYRAAAAACYAKGKSKMPKNVACKMVEHTPKKKRSQYMKGK
jgi:hypothetical protein